MPLGILSWEHLAKLNSILGPTTKAIVGLSTLTSNLTLMRPRTDMVVGVDPVQLTHMTAILQAAQTLRNGDSDICRMWKGIMDSHKSRLARYGMYPPSPSIRTAYLTLNMAAQIANRG